jgi:hypothetical protein
MKYRKFILRAAALLLLTMQLASCITTVQTDNKRPPKYKYQKAGRAW